MLDAGCRRAGEGEHTCFYCQHSEPKGWWPERPKCTLHGFDVWAIDTCNRVSPVVP